MIISTTDDAVRVAVPTDTGEGAERGAGTSTGPRTGGGEAAALWTCLVRRGMLHSECEAVEHWRLPHGGVLTSTPQHGVEEAVLVLNGELRLTTESAERVLRAGQLALLPHGARARLTADGARTRLLVLRTLTASVTDRLPSRIPELV
ncbi:cupin domain-containing protein [Streptomyces caelestis]|nr:MULTISPECIES: cupin domain-containing protein [Streptomyces]